MARANFDHPIYTELPITSNISNNTFWVAYKGTCEKCGNVICLLSLSSIIPLSVHCLTCFDEDGKVYRYALTKQELVLREDSTEQ